MIALPSITIIGHEWGDIPMNFTHSRVLAHKYGGATIFSTPMTYYAGSAADA